MLHAATTLTKNPVCDMEIIVLMQLVDKTCQIMYQLFNTSIGL